MTDESDTASEEKSDGNGFCNYVKISLKAISSIGHDTILILSHLKKDPYSKQFKYSLRKLLILRIIFLILVIGVELGASYPQAWLMNALQHKSYSEFHNSLKWIFIVVAIAVPTYALDSYLNELLVVRLREALTKILINRYHQNNNFYHIASNDNIDNPGQRIDQDVDIYVWGITQLSTIALREAIRLIGWLSILYSIGAAIILYGFLLAFFIVLVSVIIFAGRLTFLFLIGLWWMYRIPLFTWQRNLNVMNILNVIYIGRLTAIAFLLAMHCADFRGGIIRTRDNGETIAFYQASDFESFWSMKRLDKIVKDLIDQARWQSGLHCFQQTDQYFTGLLPYILLFDDYYSGKYSLGDLTQCRRAFTSMVNALSLIVNQMNRLALIQASGSRVVGVLMEMDKIDKTITQPPKIRGIGVFVTRRSVLGTMSKRQSRVLNLPNNADIISTKYRGIRYVYFGKSGSESNVSDGGSDALFPWVKQKETKRNYLDIGSSSDSNSSNAAGNLLESDFPTSYDSDYKYDDEEAEMHGVVLITHNLSIIVPNTKSLLLYKLNMTVVCHQNLLIVGPSGCGKSSLLRVLSGLWKWGGGTVKRLDDSQVMFLPQRPYLPILNEDENTLKNQLLFPKFAVDKEEKDQKKRITVKIFSELLDKLNLAYILDYESVASSGSQDWSKTLSLGEQQRLSFGRVSVANPKMVFLDEATSALDVDNQRAMYQLLQQQKITYLSVGHRLNLIEFHDVVLEIVGDGSWKIWTKENYLEHMKEEI